MQDNIRSSPQSSRSEQANREQIKAGVGGSQQNGLHRRQVV